jgi:hypothetical protein
MTRHVQMREWRFQGHPLLSFLCSPLFTSLPPNDPLLLPSSFLCRSVPPISLLWGTGLADLVKRTCVVRDSVELLCPPTTIEFSPRAQAHRR